MKIPEPYYQDGTITIYHGNCLEIVPALGAFDLLLTDPPYGTEMLGGGYGRRQIHTTDGRNSRRIAGDIDLSVATAGIGACLSKIVDGYAVVFCSPRRVLEMGAVCIGADPIGELVWDKASPGLGKGIRYQHESAIVFTVGNPKKQDTPLLSVVRSPVVRVDTRSRHPHEKPETFWHNALRLPGLRVIDPFAGSGSVGRACKDAGRAAVLIEIDERWCERAALRMMQGALEVSA